MKLCKDCKHIRVEAFSTLRFAKCYLTLTEEIDLVTGGKSIQSLLYCSTARDHGQSCGINGRLFEPREVE